MLTGMAVVALAESAGAAVLLVAEFIHRWLD